MDGFEEMYRAGRPPWDIGRAQTAFVELEARGAIRGRVLDAGCGTGENALYFASRGHEVYGIDGAPTAIAAAQRKAKARGLQVTFRVHDALALESLRLTFDTVTDCGLFHTFTDEDRVRYEKCLKAALASSGSFIALCFSEHEPGDWGPRRVTRDELRDVFRRGWAEESIVASEFASELGHAARAWLAHFRRA